MWLCQYQHSYSNEKRYKYKLRFGQYFFRDAEFSAYGVYYQGDLGV